MRSVSCRAGARDSRRRDRRIAARVVSGEHPPRDRSRRHSRAHGVERISAVSARPWQRYGTSYGPAASDASAPSVTLFCSNRSIPRSFTRARPRRSTPRPSARQAALLQCQNAGVLQRGVRQSPRPFRILPPTRKAAFLTPGITATHRARSQMLQGCRCPAPNVVLEHSSRFGNSLRFALRAQR